MRIVGVTISTLAMLCPLLSYAESKGPSQSMIDDISACLRIAADAPRLACMDVAARQLIDAATRNDVVIVEREEIKKTRRSLFGLNLDSGDLFAGKDAPSDRIEELTTVVTSIQRSGNDRWTLALAEGGRWQTTEPWLGDADPKTGMTVIVRRGALGSYVLRTKGMRTVKVRRVN